MIALAIALFITTSIVGFFITRNIIMLDILIEDVERIEHNIEILEARIGRG